MRSGRRAFIACAAPALLAGLVYVNAIHNPFVYDDYHTVVANPSIQNVADVHAIVLHDMKRPVVNLSYAIDRALYGATPFGFHVTNVLLHVLNVILLFQLARRLDGDGERTDFAEPASESRAELVAFTSAVLFAVHPMMTEAVGYVSGRSELLCATFLLAGMICGRRWLRGDGWRWAMLTVGMWAAALTAKETAAMFPFVFLAYDRFALQGSAIERRRRLFTVHVPLVATAVLAGLVRLVVFARMEYPGQAQVHWPYALVELDVVRRYVGLILYPVNQAIFHEVTTVGGLLDPRALAAMGLLGLVLVLIWRLRRSAWLVSFGILWFLLLLVPSSVLIVLNQGEPMTEHRVYAASCGLFLAAGAAAGWLATRLARAGPRWRLLVPAALALTILSFGVQTILRNVVWADPVTLWRESVDLAPNHFRPRLLLGEALQDAGRREQAVEEYQTALRLRPGEQTGYMWDPLESTCRHASLSIL